MKVKSDIIKYWNKRSDTYDRFPAPREEAEEKKAYQSLFGNHLHGENLDILDIGAGTGFVSLSLAEMGHRLTAMDITDGMLEKARSKAVESNLDIDFHIGDAEELPFPSESFDCVVCRWLLWTLPNPEKAITHWSRVLRNGGLIICIDGQWNYSSLKGKLKKLCRKAAIFIYEKNNPNNLGYDLHINESLPFSTGVAPEEAGNLFEYAGLENISTETLTEIRKIRAKNMRLLYRLALQPATFLIKGRKIKKEHANKDT